MATNTVGTSSDYSTLSAWESARQSSSDANETVTYKDEAHGDDTCTIDGWSSCDTIIIQGASSLSAGSWDGARAAPDTGTLITKSDADVTTLTIEDVAIDLVNRTGNYQIGFYYDTTSLTADTTVTIRRCKFKDQQAGSGATIYGIRVLSSLAGYTYTFLFENVLNFDGDTTDFGTYFFSGETNGGTAGSELSVTWRGCTCDQTQFNVQSYGKSTPYTYTEVYEGSLFNEIRYYAGGAATYTKTLTDVIQSATVFGGGGWTETNVTDSASFADTGTPTGSSDVWWTDAANEDYSLQDNATHNDAIDHCSTATMPTDDLVGATRGASEDAGAFEVAAAPSGDVEADLTSTGTLAGTLTGTGELAAAATATGTLAGTATGTGELADTALSATGTLAGTLTGAGELAAAATATGTLAGTATGTGELAAAATATGTLAGTATGTGELAAAATATGTLAGTLSIGADLSADLTATGTLAGTATGTGELAAAATATGTLAGTLSIGAELAAGLTSTGTLAGTLTGAGELADTALSATGTLAGTATGTGELAAGLTATGTLAGTLTGAGELADTALSATGTLAGTATGTGELAAGLTATGTLNGQVTSGDVLIDTAGPGVESWRSTIFAADVNSTTVFVYGYSEQSKQNNVAVWNLNDNIEQSWFTANAEEAVNIDITLVDATPITSAEVYPRNTGTIESIAAGVLTLTGVPANTRLRIEVNGDRAEVLSIFIAPKPVVPTLTTDYTTLVQTVSNVDIGTDELTVASTADFSNGMKVLVATDGTMPGTSAGALPEHEILFVDSVVDGTHLTLSATDGGPTLDLTTAGSGTITIAPAVHADTDNVLFFPTGVHTIGRLFDIVTDADVYLDAGAVVIGSFDIREVENWELGGRGVIAGTFANYTTDVQPLAESVRKEYSLLYGFESPDWAAENAVSGIAFVGAPYYINYYGVWSWRNVHVINCWHGEGDGLRTRAKRTNDRVAEIVDCYVFAADDAIHIKPQFDSKTVSGCFSITTANACYHAGYFPNTDNSYEFSITDCHAMHLGSADTGGYVSYPYLGMNSIIKCWMDGWEAQTALGAFNYTFRSLRVWGDMPSRLMHIGNVEYPFGTPRDQAGQLNNWSLIDVTTEKVPGQLSQIIARDDSNTPHDISFNGLVLGGTYVDNTNSTNYFEVDPEVYNLTFGLSASLSASAYLDTLASAFGALGSAGFTATGVMGGMLEAPVVVVPPPVVTPPTVTGVTLKQRIHNTLLALINIGPFYRCAYDRTTGQMTVHTDAEIAPSGIVIKETKSEFGLARYYRRQSNVSEPTTMSWVAVVSFNAEVTCEVFEEAVIASGIKVPAAVGLPDQRTLLARLADSSYDHPPEQSPSGGTVVEFMFEVVTETLRK